KPARRGPD
ncbi:hypothetical protein AB1N83_014074, partial [Pleurotus pulmonarius]